MNKKILAFAAAALFSLNASASYIQYNFTGSMAGYIIQQDGNGAIADYKVDVTIPDAESLLGYIKFGFFPVFGDGSTRITGATTYFPNGNGPTNFSIMSNWGGDQYSNISVDFSRATQGNFSYTANYYLDRYYTEGWRQFSGTVTGLATVGDVNALQAANLDYLGGHSDGMFAAAVPTLGDGSRGVPEPGSLALLGVGLIGAAGAARRRKAA